MHRFTQKRGNMDRLQTLKLIELCSDNNVQAQLEDRKRNGAVFKKISQGINDPGFQRTTNQCCEKRN